MTEPGPICTLISPDGERVTVYCVSAFCRDNGLDVRNLWRVINGERRHHRGWMSADVPAAAFAHKPHGGQYLASIEASS